MIRARLTIRVVGLVAVVLMMLAASIFLITRDGLLAEVERDVNNRADTLAAAVAREPAEALERDAVAEFGAADVVAVVYDQETGARLADSGTLPGRTPPLGDVPVGSDAGEVVEIDANGPLYVTSRVVEVNGRSLTVVVGRSPDRLYEALGRLANVLGPLTLFALVSIGTAVFVMVRRALRPLERLEAEAGRITRTPDDDAEITGSYGGDEIGALADSVRTMVDSLAEANDRARQATRDQQAFLADVSHALRAPLAVVSTSLDLADRAGGDDPELRVRLLADARAETARMARLVDRLLLMARSGAETRAADRPILVAEVAGDAARRWRALAEVERSIDVSGLREVADAAVWGNADQLQELFDVLLENAFQYTEPDTAISLSGEVDDDRVAIRVSDEGIGIPPDQLELVFERFHTGANGGTGLGLAIAKHIVEGHGGTIVARCGGGCGGGESQAGATFVIELPRWTDRATEVLPARLAP